MIQIPKKNTLFPQALLPNSKTQQHFTVTVHRPFGLSWILYAPCILGGVHGMRALQEVLSHSNIQQHFLCPHPCCKPISLLNSKDCRIASRQKRDHCSTHSFWLLPGFSRGGLCWPVKPARASRKRCYLHSKAPLPLLARSRKGRSARRMGQCADAEPPCSSGIHWLAGVN